MMMHSTGPAAALQFQKSRATPTIILLLSYLILADTSSARRAIEAAERTFPDAPRLQIIFAGDEYQEGDTHAALARMPRLHEKLPNTRKSGLPLSDLAWLAGAPDAVRFIEEQLENAADRVPGGWFVTESMRTRLAFLPCG